MRVLLIQPPFWAVNSPSIGLSYLKAALEGAGMQAEIHYSNLDFAYRIGRKDYDTVQAGLPVELLFGDVLFGSALLGDAFQMDAAQSLMRSIPSRPPVVRVVQDDFLSRFEELCSAARRFVDDFKTSAPWVGWDLVGFTTTFTLVPALAMAKAMRESGAKTPIVFGGSHCDGSLGAALMRQFPWIDFVIRGEGERSIVLLAKQLDQPGVELDSIDGLLWWEGHHLRTPSVEMARIANLDSVPLPRYDDWLGQLTSFGWNDPDNLRIPIETSRGCWYGDRNRCVFCGLNGLNDQFRSKSTDRVLMEFDHLLSYGIRSFNAVDNVLDPAHFKGLLPRLASIEPKATWFFEIRPTVTKGQLLALRNAGIRFLQPGIESLNSRLLGLMNKGTNAFQNVRLLRWTAELGMPVFWNMLFGLPGESPKDYDTITELIPSLVHLFPPLAACNRIHVDRFSPLFARHRAVISPNPAYGQAMGLSSQEVDSLAYHFEFDTEHGMDPDVCSAIERLNAAVENWQAQVGQSSLVSLDRSGKRWVFDTRPGSSVAEICLEGAWAKIHRALDVGASMEELLRASSEDNGCVTGILEVFLSRRWIVRLDDHYLNVAVPMDDLIPNTIPDSMLDVVCPTIYCEGMSRMWQASRNK